MHYSMKRIISIFLSLWFLASLNAQNIIQMVDYNGVYTIPCEVNGMKCRMLFDTGASKVSLSESFCELLLDNGLISLSDFVGEGKMLVADGRIIDHAELMLKTLKIGDVTINNVPAIVINNQNAPMLLGQSAIQMLGEVSIKGDKLYIYDGKETTKESSTSTYFERWDAKNYNYSNFTYGFGWDLPKDYEWEKLDGQEKHTVFRVAGFPFVVFVNAQVAAKDKDLWMVYDQYVEMAENLDAQAEKKTGLLVYERTFEKSTLIGHHAIKTTFKEYFKDSRYNEAQENYAEEYITIANGFILTIALKMPKDVYDAVDCSTAISEIFKGFRFTVKH